MYGASQLQQLKLKVIIVGDSGVGKTNLRMRFCHGIFEPTSEPTVGVQYSRRKFWASVQGKSNQLFTVCFWDAAGKLDENSVLPSFFKNCVGVIYAFDMTKKQSLQNLKIWRSMVYENMNVPNISEMLIGNKNDLIFLKQVTISDAEEFQKQHQIPLYFETSAMQKLNVDEAFYAFISLICRELNRRGIKKPINIAKKEQNSKCYY